MEIFKAWYGETGNSVALTPLSEINRMKVIGAWLEKPIFLHRIEAGSLEAACELHQEKMDWDNFGVQMDLVATCPQCGVRYFVQSSTSCPSCEAFD